MIIKEARLHRDGGTTTLTAKCKIRKIGWDTVYFSVGNTVPGDYVYHDASPFAAALLLPSMQQGENLVIEGSISAQLYRGMHAIMQEVLKWDIGLQPIRILIFIDQNIAKTMGYRLSHRFIRGDISGGGLSNQGG